MYWWRSKLKGMLTTFERGRKNIVWDGADIPVQQYSAESLFEILSEPSNDFFQDIHARRRFFPVWALKVQVILENLGHGLGVGEWHELVVLGDVFPVVDQHCLDVVWDGDVDHGLVVERILLVRVSF